MKATKTKTPADIRLETVHNLRTLGGYPTVYGCDTAHAFMRCGCLCPMSGDDAETLYALGVRTVIDLRGAEERRAIPDTLCTHPGVRYLPLPLMAEESTGAAAPAALPAGFTMADVYIGMLEGAKGPLLAVFRALLAGAAAGRVLFHCTAGKDRTGVVAALLLGLAGVNAGWISYDYALTGQNLLPVRDLLVSASGGDAWPPQMQEVLLGTKAADMERTLTHLNGRYGGAREYLQCIGLRPEECDALAARMRKGTEAA